MEATNFGVPMVILPGFYDQPQNAQMIVDNGVGIELNFASLTSEKILDALNKVINQTS